MDRIAVIGSSGQLGSDVVAALELTRCFRVIALTHADVECTNQNSVESALLSTGAQVVINCAAFVRVDESESSPSKAFEINAIGALHVARACTKLKALSTYISTDYVFDGAKASAYIESDIPRPINVYGASKLAGEQLVCQSGPRSLIIRTASLYGINEARGKSGNFIETIIAKAKAGEPLSVVNDIYMSPTYSNDVARTLVKLIQRNTRGLVHLSNQGSCTWYDLAKTTLEMIGSPASIEAVNSTAYGSKAQRPPNSSLVTERFDVSSLRPWREALRAYLITKGHIPSSVKPGSDA